MIKQHNIFRKYSLIVYIKYTSDNLCLQHVHKSTQNIFNVKIYRIRIFRTIF